MLRRGLPGIALMMVLILTSAAQAQIGIGIGVGGYRGGGGGGFYYGNYGRYGPGGYYGRYHDPGFYYGYGRGYYDPGYRSGVYVQPRVVAQPAFVQPADYRQAIAGPQPVYINVQVPADAEVWIDGAKTTQTGASRRFVSPPLPPGKNFTYEISAAWMKDGQPVTQKRSVSFTTGQQSEVNVDLRPAS